MGRLIAIQALNKGETNADSQSVFVPRAMAESRAPRWWLNGDDGWRSCPERCVMERRRNCSEDGRMQVYQAARLALYAASLGQEYVRSALDYVRRRGEKSRNKSPARLDKIIRTSRSRGARANCAGVCRSLFCQRVVTAQLTSLGCSLRHAGGHSRSSTTSDAPATSHALIAAGNTYSSAATDSRRKPVSASLP